MSSTAEQVQGAAPASGGRAGGARSAFWSHFRRHRPAVAGLAFVVAITVAAVFAPVLSHYSPYQMTLSQENLRPSIHHLLGTDPLGRDIMTRILYGGRVSLGVAFSSVLISTVLGTLLGTVAAQRGGVVDDVIMRVTDVFMAFPLLLLLIILTAVLGPSPLTVVGILGLFSWMGVARLVRGVVLSVMQEPYVEAATACSAGAWRIIVRHALPNAVGPIVVAATLGVSNAILSVAALSFLGLGIQPPTPDWGNMLHAAEQLQVLTDQPWVWMGPGAAIALTVLAVNFVGDGIQDALNPRRQARHVKIP